MSATEGVDDLDPQKLLHQPSYFVEELLGQEPLPYQKDFLDCGKDRRLFVAGRRVGKSMSAAWLALWYALTHKNEDVLILAKAKRQAMELFKTVKDQLRAAEDNGIDQSQWGIPRTTRTVIEFDNGSRLVCLPVGRDGSNIRGYGADLLIVDEAAFIKDEIFQEVLAPFLAVGDSTFVMTSTPLGKKGFFYDKYDAAREAERKGEEPRYYVEHAETSDNPYVKDEFIEEMRDALTPMQFKQEILGQFVEDADSYFTTEEVLRKDDDQSGGVSQPVKQETDVCYLGADIAHTGDDESVYVSMDGDGNIYDIEATYGKDLNDAIGRIETLDKYNNYDTIMVDATGLGQGVVDQLQERLGHKVEGFTFSNTKKTDLYSTLKDAFQAGDITFRYERNKNAEENKLYNQLTALEYEYTSTGRLKISHPSGGHDDYCLSEDTEILTADGWKGIDELTQNDAVAAYDGSNIAYEPPTRVIRKDFDGEMLNFVGDDFDALVTPNHKMVFDRRRKSDGECYWEEQTATAEEVAALSQGTLYGNRMFPVAAQQVGSGVDREDWELRLLGWMITEGWLSESSRWNSRRYMVGQSKEDNIERIEELVGRFDPTRYERDDGCIYWQFHKQDNEYFDDLLADGVHRIPREVLTHASARQLELVYEAMMRGDGTLSRNTYHTSSRELAEDFQELCHKIGRKANIVETTQSTGYDEEYTGYDVYVHERETYNDKARVSEVSRVPYDGRVWCVTVPSGKIVTRRNDTIMIVGNCDALALANWARQQKGFTPSDKQSMRPFNLGSLKDN